MPPLHGSPSGHRGPSSESPNKAVWRFPCSCQSFLTCSLEPQGNTEPLIWFGGKKPFGGPRATATGDAWALRSIIWEKPALLGHRVVRHRRATSSLCQPACPTPSHCPSSNPAPLSILLSTSPRSLGPLSTQQAQGFLNSQALAVRQLGGLVR